MRPADPRTPRLAALLLALPLAALAPVAAQAETLTVTNIVGAGAAGYTLAIPEVSVVDGNLTEDQVRALFSSYSTDSLASLANLSAASLTIPDIATTYTPATARARSSSTTRTWS